MTDYLIGKQLGNFRIERLLGRGGMATVYYGVDIALERPVAIKVLNTTLQDNPGYARRFVDEAKMIATWRHPNIVQVYYAANQQGHSYYVMEYIDGTSLEDRITDHLRRGELMPRADVLEIGWAVSSALDYAHGRGVIHRDVKPPNVMIATSGRVVLTDFGLALDTAQGSQGEVFGSPHFIAPEQARRSANAVPQSDLYSLGIMLYEMLTGALPFDDESGTSIALMHVNDDPPRPTEINPALNAETETVLLKALSKKPEDRYNIGAIMMQELEAALKTLPGAPGEAQPLPPEAAARAKLSRGVALHSEDEDAVGEQRDTESSRPSLSAVAPTQPDLPPRPMAAPQPEQRRTAVQDDEAGPWTAPVWVFIMLIPVLLGVGGIILVTLNNQNAENAESTATALARSGVIAPLTAEPGSDSGVFRVTITPSHTPTITPGPTNTFVPITPEETSEASPTVDETQPTPTPTATATPLPTQAAEASPVAFPDGSPVQFIYDADSFYLWNISASNIRLERFVFVGLDAEGVAVGSRLDGSIWVQVARGYQFVDPERCVAVEVLEAASVQRPDGCRALSEDFPFHALLRFNRNDVRVFWAGANTTQFAVYWDGTEIARCPSDSSPCEVRVGR